MRKNPRMKIEDERKENETCAPIPGNAMHETAPLCRRGGSRSVQLRTKTKKPSRGSSQKQSNTKRGMVIDSNVASSSNPSKTIGIY